MSTGVEALRDAVKLLTGEDPGTFGDAALHADLMECERLLDQLQVVVARRRGVWDRRGVWAGDQSRSAASRLARELNCSRATANARLRLARSVDRVPTTADAVVAGLLSADHITLLADAQAKAPERFACDESWLIAQCAQVGITRAKTVIGYWLLKVNPDGATADARDAVEAASLHASTTFDGNVVINGTLDPIGGTIFTTELQRLSDELRLTDQRNGVTRTAAQRRAAALVEMASRSASMPADARRPRPLFTVLLGEDHVTQLCELAAGTILPPSALMPYLDRADLETVLFDGHNTVVTVSKKRAFTGALRRAIEVRDRTCRHPSGCDGPAARCDVDHIVPYSQFGRTDQFNGRLECPTHNRHADKHDHNAVPARFINVDPDYVLYARLRWRYRHLETDSDSDSDGDGDGDGDSDSGTDLAS